MPKTWLYYIAICMPLLLRVMLLDTTILTDWLWYHRYADSYYFLTALSVNPRFIQFIGGWPLVIFVGTVICVWLIESEHDHDDMMEYHFLLLPLFYVPFTVIGDFLMTMEFHPVNLFVHPVIILPFGYLYILVWIIFIRVMNRFQLVV